MTKKITISLCMIVKNEEKTLDKSLSSVIDAIDEIIIVDTGSIDMTKDIAKKYTDKIYDFKWIDNFSSARNYAFSKATKDYILWLDADDYMGKSDVEKLIRLKNNFDTSVDSVTMKYILTKDVNGNPSFYSVRNRLVKRSRNFKWIGAVHEYLEVYGNIYESDINIIHNKINFTPNRNIDIYDARLKKGEYFSPRDLFYYANELCDHKRYSEAIEYYNKFIDTKRGWIEDILYSLSKLADCYDAIGDVDKRNDSIYKSFEYDAPRPEFCCRLGYRFLNENKLKQAIFWYELATKVEKPRQGFINAACSTWLPHLQLCVCYYKLGDIKKSYEYNEKARKYIPDDPMVIQNKKLLEGLLEK
ncbi:glycosyltransferase family 2 protein [Thermoanaerobacterium sp. RBIITD]|uniref:glycosyltransferase n=1 Tax=Thermoanaerobacterium sp. RBIITD TaxID=1550240 RepID=UPI000BB7C4F6|nr:glycosyltransferase family 2 protein [Thermoanaerobacterium sp. RBIITD]SNX53517.1 Glycosyltransferase involved in cell wall bisynthesis [Thermoanaerobacterium sp. RBIITD]